MHTICRGLAGSDDGSLKASFFLDLLRRGFSGEDARHQLDTAIAWGRYGELFDYDSVTDEITADTDSGIHPRSGARASGVG